MSLCPPPGVRMALAWRAHGVRMACASKCVRMACAWRAHRVEALEHNQGLDVRESTPAMPPPYEVELQEVELYLLEQSQGQAGA